MVLPEVPLLDLVLPILVGLVDLLLVDVLVEDLLLLLGPLYLAALLFVVLPGNLLPLLGHLCLVLQPFVVLQADWEHLNVLPPRSPDQLLKGYVLDGKREPGEGESGMDCPLSSPSGWAGRLF